MMMSRALERGVQYTYDCIYRMHACMNSLAGTVVGSHYLDMKQPQPAHRHARVLMKCARTISKEHVSEFITFTTCFFTHNKFQRYETDHTLWLSIIAALWLGRVRSVRAFMS